MRPLTSQEIDYILVDVASFFPNYLPVDIKYSYIRNIIQNLRLQLEKEKVHDHFKDIASIKKEIERYVALSNIEPGEGVGVICAQSIGERQTQLTLNSFHSSGLCVATVVTGVPRFLELLNATKEPKVTSNNFYLKEKVKTPDDCRNLIKDSLVHHTLNDLVVSEKIFLNEKEEEFWFGAYEMVFSNQFRYYRAGITFTLDIEKLYKYKIEITTIKEKIEYQYGDICCVISPLYVGQIDIFVDTSDIQIPDTNDLPQFLKDKNHIEIYIKDVVKPRILEVEICGIKNIKNYHYQLVQDNWLIQTSGSNFMDILSLPYIDISSISSNNMWDIFNVMGIEATREFLIEEFTNVVSSDGTFINPAHIILLVDIMTYQGNINSVSRYGMKKEQMGVLSRASFEESLDQFCNAGFYSEKDFIKSVSANIMCGKRSSIGSGLCSLKMNWDLIRETESKKV
jgi:DNA-directed RNA polymerase II subunit RPB1